MWPIPTSDMLYLDGVPADAVVSLHDATGRTLLWTRSLRTSEPMDMRALTPGSYHLLVRSAGHSQVHRVVVSR